MINGRKVIVVMPAYNAAKTLRTTYDEVMATAIVDLMILVDDGSTDGTYELAGSLPGIKAFAHSRNQGYGANQKTCYRYALEAGADIVVMVHPDYQYTPRLLPALVWMVASGVYPCALGSRILGGQALKGGMPAWKYAANRALTLYGNAMLGTKVSEFHTGYRAFSRELLECLPLKENSDDFVFDNQILAQIAWFGLQIGEVSCPAQYSPESSSIDFKRSVVYGLGCVWTGFAYRLAKMRLISSPLFPRHDRS